MSNRNNPGSPSALTYPQVWGKSLALSSKILTYGNSNSHEKDAATLTCTSYLLGDYLNARSKCLATTNLFEGNYKELKGINSSKQCRMDVISLVNQLTTEQEVHSLDSYLSVSGTDFINI